MLKFKGLVISNQQVEILKKVYSISCGGEICFSNLEGKTVYEQMIDQGAIEE